MNERTFFQQIEVQLRNKKLLQKNKGLTKNWKDFANRGRFNQEIKRFPCEKIKVLPIVKKFSQRNKGLNKTKYNVGR